MRASEYVPPVSFSVNVAACLQLERACSDTICHSTHPENVPLRVLGYLKMLCPRGMLWICDNCTHEAGWSVILDVLQQAEGAGLVSDVDAGFHEYQGRIRIVVKCQRSPTEWPVEDPSFILRHGVCLLSFVLILTVFLFPCRCSSRCAVP